MLADLKTVLALGATCKFLHEVVSNGLFWLKRLCALEQDDAPNLPRHVSLRDLTLEELRTLVERAHRRRLNCTGSAPTRPTREITIRVSLNSDGTPDRRFNFLVDMELLPGGALLLVLWGSGYLQCWTVPGGECLWTYRPPDSRVLLRAGFAYEMQADGDVRVPVVSEPDGWDTSGKTLRIFQISPHRGKTPKRLYKYTTEHDSMRGMLVARLSGDVFAILMVDRLLLTFWKEERSVIILNCVLEDVHLVDGYIIGALQHHRDKSIIAISLSSIRNILPSASDSRVAQILTLERDIPYASCLVPRIPTMSCSYARLSICTFHWKSEAERKRKGISITMSMDMFNQEASRYFSVLDSFILTTTAGTVSPNANLPSITHLERPGTMILDSQIRKDSQVSRPSQAGSVMIKFGD
ncbi:hypothetical protein DFH11DRAFT_1883725 [Phellopilus nigrolimitatus]|nr:hypothetical protein DFH11DRAFT_1883725 [Phellopilus nigrolimitatus]